MLYYADVQGNNDKMDAPAIYRCPKDSIIQIISPVLDTWIDDIYITSCFMSGDISRFEEITEEEANEIMLRFERERKFIKS